MLEIYIEKAQVFFDLGLFAYSSVNKHTIKQITISMLSQIEFPYYDDIIES